MMPSMPFRINSCVFPSRRFFIDHRYSNSYNRLLSYIKTINYQLELNENSCRKRITYIYKENIEDKMLKFKCRIKIESKLEFIPC